MRGQTNRVFSFLIILRFFTFALQGLQFAEAGKRRVQITDDLDDIVDNEEDDEWQEWGKMPSPSPVFDIPPEDLDKMEISQIQEKMMKHYAGPVFGFVKLRLGVQRTPNSVNTIAKKWKKMLKVNGIDLNFLGMDLSTIMFTMQRGQDKEELKDFLLDQSEAYEVKIGHQVFRRPGDPPLEEAIEMLRIEKDKIVESTSGVRHPEKEEL